MNGSVAMLRRDIRSIPRRQGSGDAREAVGFVKALGAVFAGEKFELPVVVLGVDGWLFQAVEFVHGFSVGDCPKQEANDVIWNTQTWSMICVFQGSGTMDSAHSLTFFAVPSSSW